MERGREKGEEVREAGKRVREGTKVHSFFFFTLLEHCELQHRSGLTVTITIITATIIIIILGLTHNRRCSSESICSSSSSAADLLFPICLVLCLSLSSSLLPCYCLRFFPPFLPFFSFSSPLLLPLFLVCTTPHIFPLRTAPQPGIFFSWWIPRLILILYFICFIFIPYTRPYITLSSIFICHLFSLLLPSLRFFFLTIITVLPSLLIYLLFPLFLLLS